MMLDASSGHCEPAVAIRLLTGKGADMSTKIVLDKTPLDLTILYKQAK